MGDQLDQIQADYVPTEDRILLKLRAGNKLYRAWITRRYMGLLLPILQGVHPQSGERFADAPAMPPEQDARFEPQQQAPLEEAAQEVMLEYPLGETPILLTDIHFEAPKDGSPGQLVLNPRQGQGLVLPYTAQMNHLLLKLLLSTLARTDWCQPLKTRYGIDTTGSAALQ